MVYKYNIVKKKRLLFLINTYSSHSLDRFSPENLQRSVPGCEIVADVAFLIDASGSIREEYLAQLQFVQYIIAR